MKFDFLPFTAPPFLAKLFSNVTLFAVKMESVNKMAESFAFLKMRLVIVMFDVYPEGIAFQKKSLPIIIYHNFVHYIIKNLSIILFLSTILY